MTEEQIRQIVREEIAAAVRAAVRENNAAMVSILRRQSADHSHYTAAEIVAR